MSALMKSFALQYTLYKSASILRCVLVRLYKIYEILFDTVTYVLRLF